MTVALRTLPAGAPENARDDGYASAVARLDADLAAAAVACELDLLRSRAVRAYEDALAHAAGRPDDLRWRVLARIVAAFVSRIPAGASSQISAAAVARLTALVDENLD
jgi:hypothetical protein